MTDFEYYQECRKALQTANNILLDAIPRSDKGSTAFIAAAKALQFGVRSKQILYPSEASVERLFEFVLYEPAATGSIWARQVLDTQDEFSPLERTVVEAVIAAEPSLFEVTEVNRADHKLALHDLFRDRADIWITDRNLSQTARTRGILFCRPVDMGRVCFASGGTIAFGRDNKEMLLRNAGKLERIKNPVLRRRKQFAMFVNLEKHSSIGVVYK
jgi:hypothetical protein